MMGPIACLLPFLLISLSLTNAFFVHNTPSARLCLVSTINPEFLLSLNKIVTSEPLQMVRYGPKDMDFQTVKPEAGTSQIPPNVEGIDRNKIKLEFRNLINTVVNIERPENLPSLLTMNIQMILAAMGAQDLIEEILQEDFDTSNKNDDRLDEVSNAVNMIVSFTETFVEQTKTTDNVYKKLLGKIFESITPSKNNQIERKETLNLEVSMELNLDEMLAQEKDAFTPGFLRHVEGECNRIAALPTLSPESLKMLQILRLIQTRVLEELGKGIGEGAIVLGQLLGYEEKSERLAVLDAGLTVRGVDFAYELSALTSEALEGFRAMRSQVDPVLLANMQEIDERIRLFIHKNLKQERE